MISKCSIDAVHPTAKRVIKSNMTPDEMADLMIELIEAGYEIGDIQVTQEVIYEDGDYLELKLSTIQRLARKCRSHRERKTVKEILGMMKMVYGDNLPDKMLGKVVHKRTNWSYGDITIEWQVESDWDKTNVYLLKEIGYQFKEPEFDEIPIDKADDDMLNDDERVIKYLMLDNHWNKETAESHMQVVYAAMHKAGCVMYQP